MRRCLLLVTALLPPSAGWPAYVEAGCQFENERLFCTEAGPLRLRRQARSIAAVYELLDEQRLGTIVVTLADTTVEGRWSESDDEGRVVLRFTKDFSAFDIEYRRDEAPDVVRRALRGLLHYADGGSTFTLDEVTYRCE